MITNEELQKLAEQSALKFSDECTENNHSHDCPCSSHEEGFIEGYKANNTLLEFENWYKETIDANVYTNRKAVLDKIQSLKQ